MPELDVMEKIIMHTPVINGRIESVDGIFII